MKKRVGLVTVLFNSADVLPGFFESLSRQTSQDYWLYILDNSPDNLSYEAAELQIEKYALPNVSLIKNDQNVGVAAANNQGIEMALDAGCEYLFIINNDIEFDDHYLFENMVALADSRKEKLMVPKMYFHDSRLIWCAGGEFRKLRGTVHHFGEMQPDHPENSATGYTGYAPTCFMLVHREVFERIGKMDEKYFVYYDDVDFVYRAKQAGYRLLYWAEGKITHKVSSSTGGDESSFSIFYINRNRVYFIRKNYRGIMRLTALGFTVISRILKTLRAVDSGKRAIFRKAILAGMRMPLN